MKVKKSRLEVHGYLAGQGVEPITTGLTAGLLIGRGLAAVARVGVGLLAVPSARRLLGRNVVHTQPAAARPHGSDTHTHTHTIINVLLLSKSDTHTACVQYVCTNIDGRK